VEESKCCLIGSNIPTFAPKAVKTT